MCSLLQPRSLHDSRLVQAGPHGDDVPGLLCFGCEHDGDNLRKALSDCSESSFEYDEDVRARHADKLEEWNRSLETQQESTRQFQKASGIAKKSRPTSAKMEAVEEKVKISTPASLPETFAQELRRKAAASKKRYRAVSLGRSS